MKRISVIVAFLLLIMLIFFTFFGDEAYRFITPKVKTSQVSGAQINKTLYSCFPKSALVDGEYVYIIMQEQGFSMTLNTVHKQKVSLINFSKEEKEQYYIDDSQCFVDAKELRMGTLIVSELDDNTEFEDGDRVVLLD